MTTAFKTTVLGADGVTEIDVTEETTMQPSALAMAVGALCRPGGLTPENQRRVEEAILAPRCLSPEAERAQAIRLAREARAIAGDARDIAQRRYDEANLAVLDLTGESPLYANCLRARLEGDEDAIRAARVEFYADDFLRSHTPPPVDVADAVTARVAELRNERENAKH
jgi:hypothetical protein